MSNFFLLTLSQVTFKACIINKLNTTVHFITPHQTKCSSAIQLVWKTAMGRNFMELYVLGSDTQINFCKSSSPSLA